MSKENNSVELNEKDLEMVTGGAGTYNGIVFKDKDVYVLKGEDLSGTFFNVLVLENCGPYTCDIDLYHYYKAENRFNYIGYYDTLEYSRIYKDYDKLEGVTFTK